MVSEILFSLSFMLVILIQELKDLEQELKALYSQQKLAKEEELDAQKSAVASR